MFLYSQNPANDFEKYKLPYLTANFFAILPEEVMNKVLEDGSVFDKMFEIILDPSTSDMY